MTEAKPNSIRPVNPPRGRVYDSIVDTIGATPLVRINRLAAEAGAKAAVLAKLEFFNPLASVKDRIGIAMNEAMEQSGKLKPGATRSEEQTTELQSLMRISDEFFS